MKRTIATLTVFAALTITFSSLSGCSSSLQNANNTNASSNANGANTVNANAKNGETKSSIYPPLASGLAEADFELIDTGEKMKISGKKGKVLLVNIWGTWCIPCRAEMPTLISLQDKYREQGFEVIGANIGDGDGGTESNEKIKKFVDEMKLNYTIVRSSNATTREFYSVTRQQVVPQSLLVDRDGHLRAVFIGGGPKVFASMEETIAKAMTE